MVETRTLFSMNRGRLSKDNTFEKLSPRRNYIRKTRIMASSPITSWQADRGKVQTMSDFTFLGSKINANSDCSHKIVRSLLLGKTAMSNLDSVLKSRDTT